MKALVGIVIILFLSFLAAPTVISLLDDGNDVSITYSLNEEEVDNELQEIEADLNTFMFCFLPPIKELDKITINELQKHKNVFGAIFYTPPELIAIA
ncbi:hypothetical protein [Flavobacterium litorale]|uniref:Uncharacterized protein n=1 Tax=Flavobacterium litorale TaxID=2856519 RepID=A0ABX8VAQ8_9FLAO|nr:hypothetical protein [Flavobacterium litorale]QYJ68121.1 hypothetical protein K1I41_11415 [Flavobacterium litorale]